MSPALTRIATLVAVLSFATFIPFATLAFQPPAKPADATATTSETTEEAAATPTGDPIRGKRVFQQTGNCDYCHGWAGDGQHGKHPRSPGIAANLRESQLDTAAMMEIVRCGIPGTAMPYHSSQAYKDPEACFGLVMDDFEPGSKPERGKTFRENDIANVVAYVQTAFQGKGPVTLADCEEALKPGDSACDFLR